MDAAAARVYRVIAPLGSRAYITAYRWTELPVLIILEGTADKDTPRNNPLKETRLDKIQETEKATVSALGMAMTVYTQWNRSKTISCDH
jgi:hypothetical protein